MIRGSPSDGTFTNVPWCAILPQPTGGDRGQRATPAGDLRRGPVRGRPGGRDRDRSEDGGAMDHEGPGAASGQSSEGGACARARRVGAVAAARGRASTRRRQLGGAAGVSGPRRRASRLVVRAASRRRTSTSTSSSTPVCSCPTAGRICRRCCARRPRRASPIRLLLGDPESEAVARRGAEERVGDAMAARIRLSMSYMRAGVRGAPASRSGCTKRRSTTRSSDSTTTCSSTCTPTARWPRSRP